MIWNKRLHLGNVHTRDIAGAYDVQHDRNREFQFRRGISQFSQVASLVYVLLNYRPISAKAMFGISDGLKQARGITNL